MGSGFIKKDQYNRICTIHVYTTCTNNSVRIFGLDYLMHCRDPTSVPGLSPELHLNHASLSI